MTRFSHKLVKILRHDITHLDLSMNNIRRFDFLCGFKKLKSLIVDGNLRMDLKTLPQMASLELFYANKCNIDYPLSFVNHVAKIFPSLKYFSMINPPQNSGTRRSRCFHEILEAEERRLRMYTIFVNPNLLHFNDKEITDVERKASKAYHKYLGPNTRRLSESKHLPGTDNLEELLTADLRHKAKLLLSLETEDYEDQLSENLASVSIADYLGDEHKKIKSRVEDVIEN